MPRHAKSTKLRRDSSMLRGIRKHLTRADYIRIADVEYTDETLALLFQEHLDAMTAVERSEGTWRAALERELEVETRLKRAMTFITGWLQGRYGNDSPTLRDFGIKPSAPPKMRVPAKAVAIEKRRATRKMRGTMGRRQRAKIKG